VLVAARRGARHFTANVQELLAAIEAPLRLMTLYLGCGNRSAAAEPVRPFGVETTEPQQSVAKPTPVSVVVVLFF